MSASTMLRIPTFLRYLASLPSAHQAFTALYRGPLVALRPVAGMLWTVHDDAELVSIATFGFNREEVDRYARLPLHLNFDVCVAVRDQTIRVLNEPMYERDGLGDVDAAFWARTVTRVGAHSIVRVPLLSGGRSIGCFGLLSSELQEDDPALRQSLEACGAALSLWLSHPDVTPQPVTTTSREWTLAFSPRQKQILRLVEQGQSSQAIGRELSLSVSTVKQDVQHAMRALDTSDRNVAVERARALGLLD